MNTVSAEKQKAVKTSSSMTVMSTVLFLVKSVMIGHLSKAERFIHFASQSEKEMDIPDILRIAPCPVLRKSFDASKCASAYPATLWKQPSDFDEAIPGKSVSDFLDTLYVSVNVSPAVFIVALIYLDRLVVHVSGLFLRKANYQKLFGVAFMLAAKWHEDCCHPPQYYAGLIQTPTEELNDLELVFLQNVSYSLFVSPEDFCEAKQSLIATAVESFRRPLVWQCLNQSCLRDLEEGLKQVCAWAAHQSTYESSPDTSKVEDDCGHSHFWQHCVRGYRDRNWLGFLDHLLITSPLRRLLQEYKKNMTFSFIAASEFWTSI